MFRKRSFSPAWRGVSVFVVLCILLTACGPAATPAQEPVEPPRAPAGNPEPTQGPRATPPPAATPAPASYPPATLRIMLAVLPGEEEYYSRQIASFQKLQPAIKVEVMYVRFYDLWVTLSTRVAAGDTPDIAGGLSYNDLAALRGNGMLLSLGDSQQYVKSGFLPGAVETAAFDGQLYGLPWLRAACSPTYNSLAIFKRAEKYFDQANALVRYLAEPQFQISNYKEHAWYPTRQSIYDELGLKCAPVTLLRLDPGLVVNVQNTVKERSVKLSRVLKDNAINFQEATAVVEAGNALVSGAVVYPTGTPRELRARFESEGLIVGALFLSKIAPDLSLPTEGDYALQCKGDKSGKAACFLLDPAGGSKQVPLASYVPDASSINTPVCTAEQGSRLICWYVDGLKFCVKVGK